MILKGLPDSYKPFVVHITQSTSEITFAMFKSQLKSYEETEKFNCKPKTDQVMKLSLHRFLHPVMLHVMLVVAKAGHIMKDCLGLTKLRVKQPSACMVLIPQVNNA